MRKQGLKISLPGQLFRLFVLLVEHAGEVVTREEIRNFLWSDSFVNFDDSINSAIKRLRQCLEDSAENPRLIETLPGHGYRFAVPVERITPHSTLDAGAGDTVRPRVAVLPFQNLSGDASDEYLANGLTDALVTALAKVPALRVKPLCSMMVYKGARKGFSEAGGKLKVDVVVQGAIVRSGSSVRVTAKLLSVTTEELLWAESYDHEFHDMLAFQTDVAGVIAKQLTDQLTPGWRPVLSRVRPRRPAAYEAYLKAHHVFKNLTAEGLWKARHYWKKAVHEDPDYANAYAGLAESYNMLGIAGLLRATDALAQAREAAKKALEIDGSLSEAHTALACTHMLEWDWAGAGREFRQAIQLDPSLATGNPCHYAEYLMAVGEPGKAISELERAQEIQPLSLILRVILGWVYYGSRYYDRAVRQHQKLLAFDSHFALTHVCLAMDYSQKRWYRAAIEQCRKAKFSGGTRDVLRALGYAYAKAGEKDRARQILKESRELTRDSCSTQYAFATVYAALGEKDAAFDWLGRAYEVRDAGLIWLNWDPQLENLRSDARFQSLLRGMGLHPRAECDSRTA
jgi:TolB-like protein/Tfp pilus assembly protein PilF